MNNKELIKENNNLIEKVRPSKLILHFCIFRLFIRHSKYVKLIILFIMIIKIIS